MNQIEIKNTKDKFSYKLFFKEYKWVHYTLICLLLLSILIVVLIFSKCFRDFSALGEFGGWASMISGILTYIGSSFLGLIVFFNTWQRQKIEDEANKLTVDVACKCYASENNFRPYTKEEIELLGNEYKTWGGRSGAINKKDNSCGYLGIRIMNLNDGNPMYMSIESVYYLSEENLLKEVVSYNFKATKEFGMPLDYKETNWCYIGVDGDIFEGKEYVRVVYVFRFINVKGDRQYCLYCVNLFKNGINPLTIYITEKEYKKSMKDGKHPFGKYKSILEFMGEKRQI